MKVKDRLASILAIAPKGPSPTGQMYAIESDLQRKYDRITVWTIFRSDENTHLVRPHVFDKKKALSPIEWHAWLSANLDKIQRMNVLPGINKRTGKTYFVYKRLGWIGHARKFANSAAVGRKWRPAKQPGQPNQQNHIRRGQRNQKRRTA